MRRDQQTSKRGKEALQDARQLLQEAKELDAQVDVRRLDAGQIVERYQGLCDTLVRNTMRQLSLSRRHQDDMLGDAHTGLLEALDRYDPQQGAAFSTFAYYRIRGQILDGLRQRGVIRRTRSAHAALSQAATRLAQAEPAPETSAASSPRSDRRLQHVDRTIRQMSAAWMVIQTLTAESEQREARRRPDKRLLDAQQRQQLHQQLSVMPDTERQLLEMVYFEGLQLQEASARLGFSKSWGTRTHARALLRLQKLMSSG